MGVETIAYSIPPERVRKMKRNVELLEKLSNYAPEVEPDWDFENYSFAKGWEETVKIIRAGGFPSFEKKLNHENYWDADDYEVWSVTPQAVKKVAEDLKTANFESLKSMALAKKLTNYYGEEIAENMYGYYIGDIEEIKAFLRQTAEKGNFLLFSTV